MKVIHISADVIGGAARAASRIHNALVKVSDIDSRMLVRVKSSDDWRVTGPTSKIIKTIPTLFPFLDELPSKLKRTTKQIPNSTAWLSTLKAKNINQTEADIINLHWTCAGFLSIEEISRIKKPLVWTLHDMWGFCGAEHLAMDDEDARWRIGYTKANRDPDCYIDIDRWVWNRKRKAWSNPMHIISPSNWLADCARSSLLMRNWDITVIHNALDVDKYKPIQKMLAREILCLPLNSKLVLFGAIRGTLSPHKGWDLLRSALLTVAKRVPDVQAIIFGQSEPQKTVDLGMPIHWFGHVHDDSALALLYSAADVMVVPSKQEAFGQTASEAQACGCPVVAFDATGLKDIVSHMQTGYLARPYSNEDLAAGIEWVLKSPSRHMLLSAQSRERSVRLWSYQAIVPQYLSVYERALSMKINGKS